MDMITAPKTPGETSIHKSGQHSNNKPQQPNEFDSSHMIIHELGIEWLKGSLKNIVSVKAQSTLYRKYYRVKSIRTLVKSFRVNLPNSLVYLNGLEWIINLAEDGKK